MEIHRSGARPSRKGEANYFTGGVEVLPVIEAPAPARVRAVSVTFAPGARTFWHTHPLGQSLLITAGNGRVQRWGGPVETVTTGDVIWFPPGEKHWHGAATNQPMTHIAIQEALEGKTVEWLEEVVG